MATYLVTGANRGIGLELTKQLLELPSSSLSKIFALSRSAPTGGLQDLVSKNPGRLFPITTSINSTESVQKAAAEVKAKLDGQGLDVLVNNAGVAAYTDGSVANVAPEQLAEIFNVNVVGTQIVTAAFLPLLEAGGQKKVINVSSAVGSIALAPHLKAVPSHAYKISKAALNMLNAQWAMDYGEKGFTFAAISPGWLKTDLGGQNADLEVSVGVAALKKFIIETDKERNGKFYNIDVPGADSVFPYDGKEIPY